MWNTDISKAPRGKYVVVNRKFGSTPADVKVFEPDRVVLATKCAVVTLSQYLPEQKRWEFLGHGEQPVAWMHVDGLSTRFVELEDGTAREAIVLPAHPSAGAA